MLTGITSIKPIVNFIHVHNCAHISRLFHIFTLAIGLLIFTSTIRPLSAQMGMPISYQNGMVVSANKEAAEAGVEILKLGGNAIDAAVATHFALAVTYPAAGNIGGGGFMVIHLSNGESYTLDYREVSSINTDLKDYIGPDGKPNKKSVQGILSVGIPGSVDGMITALERYGTMPLDMVIEPAIQLARDGFILSWFEAQNLNTKRDDFLKYAGSTTYFTKANGELYQAGERFIQSDLAQTLERIAEFGRTGFYQGLTADLIHQQMEKMNGYISLEDLESYKSVWRTPLKSKYKGYDLIMMPPPSSGGIAMAQILKMIEPYPLTDYGWNSFETVHLLTEAERRAYADRSRYLGDPDYIGVPTPLLISKGYNRERMQSFNPKKATKSDDITYGRVPFFIESHETTHFSVMDSYGNAVSVTTTLNSSYGSKIAVEGAGFLLNNEMDDFSVMPDQPNQFGLLGGKANQIAKNKRMVSSMTPTIVKKDGKVVMILGSPGGSTIITTVLQTFLNVAEFGMNIQQAVSAPRVHHQWYPNQIFADPYSISRYDEKRLIELGHTVYFKKDYAGQALCITIDSDGIIYGGVDPRGNGYAAGY